MILNATTVFQDNLVEILLTVILAFNVGAYKFVWNAVKENRESTDKNTESINMIINRIFGLEEDPTDEGYLLETERRFDRFDDKLDRIAEGQKEAKKERQQEHEEVRRAINFIVEELSKEDNIGFEGEKL